MFTPRTLALLSALFLLTTSATAQELVACDRTCSASIDLQVVPNSDWTVSGTSTDGAGTQVCETCENCKGTVTYLYFPSNPNRQWHIENDPGLSSHDPSAQDGSGMTYGSINMSSSCDDGLPASVTGTTRNAQGDPLPGFTAYLYCYC